METAALGASRPLTVTADAQPKVTTRLLFVDNIRVFLTILVILHHLMITYAGSGRWYYNEGLQDYTTNLIGSWFCSINQGYFMGLFLLISAYFVPGSYDRKGPGRFLKDRLIRLGIPLAIFSWIINPLFVYTGLNLALGVHVPLGQFLLSDYWFKYQQPFLGAGPLWFIEVLLILSLVYVLWRLVIPSRPARPVRETPFPGNGVILLFALLLGIAGFLVRLVFPADLFLYWPLNLQLGFFAQYIVLFIVGLVAYRRNWLVNLPDKQGRLWLGIAVLFILLWWWVPLYLSAADLPNADILKGGWNWQSLALALWESFTCTSMCIGVIYIFRRYLNSRGKLATFLVPNAYTAYLIHALVITIVALVLRDLLPLYPLLKWFVVAWVVVPLCFGLSALIRKLPYTDRVL